MSNDPVILVNMCVLHVSSQTASFAEFLEKTTLPIYQADEDSFSANVSAKDWLDVGGQVEDAYKFLLKYESELRELVRDYQLDDIRFDLPYYCRLDEQIFMQCDYLPPKFLHLAGDIGVGLELSLYST